MALYLEGKTRLSAMFFPSRRQQHESRDQVYRHGRAQGSHCDCRPEWQWQAGHGVHRGNQGQQHSAVYPRSARRVACDLGRRDLGGLALRSAAAPGGAGAGLRSAAQCVIEGRQQERQGGCAQTGRLVAHGDAAPGLPRRTWTTDAARVGRSYQTISQDLNRVMNRLKALYRAWGIPCAGTQVYAARYREEWLNKIPHAGVRRRAELLYQQLDGLQGLRRTLRPELLAESRKHKAAKLLRQIPCIGPIRAARLLALMQTPHRFRSKRQLWTYSGLGIETHDSAQYRYVRGQLQRSKKPQQIRGLNQNHNHEMKEIFKGAATRASCGVGPLRDFYVALLDKGMRPEMARLTLARKIAAIALTLWKKEERFDAEQLKTQAA